MRQTPWSVSVSLAFRSAGQPIFSGEEGLVKLMMLLWCRERPECACRVRLSSPNQRGNCPFI